MENDNASHPSLQSCPKSVPPSAHLQFSCTLSPHESYPYPQFVTIRIAIRASASTSTSTSLIFRVHAHTAHRNLAVHETNLHPLSLALVPCRPLICTAFTHMMSQELRALPLTRRARTIANCVPPLWYHSIWMDIEKWIERAEWNTRLIKRLFHVLEIDQARG